ncbi:MAG: D-Ala-D-Ala carboxypeptidase family metallohydrolase [Cyanobacteria bacterium J06554_11]
MPESSRVRVRPGVELQPVGGVASRIVLSEQAVLPAQRINEGWVVELPTTRFIVPAIAAVPVGTDGKALPSLEQLKETAPRPPAPPPPVRQDDAVYTVRVLSNTWFKLSANHQAKELPADKKTLVRSGTVLALKDHEPAARGHVILTMATLYQGRAKWAAYGPHVAIEGNLPDNQPNNEDPPTQAVLHRPNPGKRGRKINLSFGFRCPRLNAWVNYFYLGEPVLAGGNFSWAEVTKNGQRIPTDAKVIGNAIRIAKAMEEVRKRLGSRTVTVTSWYRDPATNRRVGGASRSRHLVGDAVDFVVAGIAPKRVNTLLDGWWGSRGGLASASSFTHIDARGHRARWSYGF